MQELQKELGESKKQKNLQAAPPPHWDYMGNNNICVVDLLKDGNRLSANVGSTELQMIVRRFEESGKFKRGNIVRVVRLQNIRLWTKFELRKREILESMAATDVNERMLWHGADKSTLAIVASEGFDIRVSQLTGLLGAGTYFARDSSYSDDYAKSGPHAVGTSVGRTNFNPGLSSDSGTRAMFLCRVVLGRIGMGSSGLRKPPEGKDSVSSGSQHIFAVFDNAQAYPEYLVSYKH